MEEYQFYPHNVRC